MRVDIPGKGPIEFEGQKLSDVAKYFEITPDFHSFPKDSKQWILDLHYAWAKGRSAESELILKTCQLLRIASQKNVAALTEKIEKGFKVPAAQFLDSWFQSLETIGNIAAGRQVCYWIIRPEKGEADIFLKTAIKIITKNAHYQKAGREFKRLVETIPNAPEAEKIQFILDFTNSYSDEE